MLEDFWKDLNAGHTAELLVKDVFSSRTLDYDFRDVSEEREYFSRGDLVAIDKNGNETCIEVKNDSRFGDTHNILCEDQVYYDAKGWCDGFMHNSYEIFCIVSQSERRIYVIDFKVLRQIYKKGEFRQMQKYSDQFSYVYLLPLWLLKTYNGLITIVNY